MPFEMLKHRCGMHPVSPAKLTGRLAGLVASHDLGNIKWWKPPMNSADY